MKLVTHVPRDRPDRPRLGTVVGTAAGALTVVDLRAAAEATEQLNSPSTKQASSTLGDALAFLRTGEEALRVAERLREWVLATAPEGLRSGLLFPLQSVRPLLPVPRPGKAICVGLNRFAHRAEIGRLTLTFPVGFVKLQGTLVDCNCTATRPPHVGRLDYMAELAVVIGRQCKHVLRERACEAIAGYTPFNDSGARNIRFAAMARGLVVRGKNLNGSGPSDPGLGTRDEIPEPHTLAIRCHVNGQLR